MTSGSTNACQTQLTVHLWPKLNDRVKIALFFPCQLNAFHDRVVSERQKATEYNSQTRLFFGLLMRNLFTWCKCAFSRLWPWAFQVPLRGTQPGCASSIVSQNTLKEAKAQTWSLAFGPWFIQNCTLLTQGLLPNYGKTEGQLKHFFLLCGQLWRQK